MRHIFPILLSWFYSSIAIAGLVGDSTVKTPPTATIQGLFGPVRSVRDTTIFYSKGIKRTVPEPERTWYVEYDRNGRATSSYDGVGGGRRDTIKRLFTWEERRVEMRIMLADTLLAREQFLLDESGRVVEWSYLNSGRYFTNDIEQYDYNERGSILSIRSIRLPNARMKVTDSNGPTRDTITCRYDSRGRIVEWHHSTTPDRSIYYWYSNDSRVRYEATCVIGSLDQCSERLEITRDSAGQVLEKHWFDRRKPDVALQTGFGSYGGQTLKEELVELHDSMWYSVGHSYYNYDIHNNLIEILPAESGDGIERATRYNYVYDKYGNWTECTEFRHDSEGKWEQTVAYHRGIIYY